MKSLNISAFAFVAVVVCRFSWAQSDGVDSIVAANHV
jgi:hypothetical protein